jgi:zinc transporter ZupT
MDFIKVNVINWMTSNDSFHTAFMTCVAIMVVCFGLIVILPHNLPMRYLNGFSAGTIIGDLFIHVFPYLYKSHDDHPHEDGTHHHHSHDLKPALSLITGIFFFVFLESMIHKHVGYHHHCHDDNNAVSAPPSRPASRRSSRTRKSYDSGDEQDGLTGVLRRRGRGKKEQDEQEKKQYESKSDDYKKNEQTWGKGVTFLLASFIHSMADGLTLTFAHKASPIVGYSTSLAILLHEIPHKISDYSKIQQNFSRPLLVSSLMSLSLIYGCFLSQLFSSNSTLIMAFAAGGMLYSSMSHIEVGLSQTAGALTGVVLMILIALNE